MTDATKTPKAEKKIRAKVSKKFVGPNGDLSVVLHRVAPNNILTFVVHTKESSELSSKGKKKKIRQRGASEVWKTEAEAKAAVDKLVGKATKLGWQPKTKSTKSDSFDFDNLPAAAAKK
jgi:hypothetical protein